MDSGNPHPSLTATTRTMDPWFFWIRRVTSAHAYLNGYVKFSKEATFKPVKLPPMPGAPVVPPEGVATGKSGSTSESSQSTSKKDKK